MALEKIRKKREEELAQRAAAESKKDKKDSMFGGCVLDVGKISDDGMC